MNGWVADYSEARPGAAALKAAGATGGLRYAGALNSSFNITAAEVADLHAYGLPVGIVCEQQVDAIMGGHLVGNTLALAALRDTRAAGLPDGLVYFAGDSDLTLGGPTSPGSPGDVQMGKVADTLAGAAGVLGWNHVGFYGGFWAIQWLIDKAVPVAAFWQASAPSWSWDSNRNRNFLTHPRAALVQYVSPPQVVPRDVDYNSVHGDWHPRTIPAPPPPPSGGGMDTRTLQQNLVHIGWPLTIDGVAGPNTVQAVRDFQYGYWRAGTRLTIDGVAGPLTQAAISRCVGEGGKAAQHFYFREMACRHCGWIRAHGGLFTGLEIYRAALSPGGLGIVSGYRCPVRNAQVGGASDSQHLYGTAADVSPIASVSRVEGLRQFSGIEYRNPSGQVYHVDVRHLGPDNNTRSDVFHPSVFPWP